VQLGELHCEVGSGGSSQIIGTEPSVVTVSLQSPGKRQSHRVQDRGDRPSDRTQVGVTFADVVDKGGNDHVVGTTELPGVMGDGQGMALILGRLGEEQ